MLVFYIVMELVFSTILFLFFRNKRNFIARALCYSMLADALLKFIGSLVELPKPLTITISYAVMILAFSFIAQIIRKASVVANDLDNTRNTK